MTPSLPIVSVVIAAKNEEKNIGNCLDSVLKQTYPSDRMEIIVVDNDSTDNTKKIAEKYTEKVFNRGPERSAQRNFGARQGRGKYYLYLDADMTLSPNAVAECVEKMEKDGDSIALYIPEIVVGEKFWTKVRRFERSFYNATAIDCVRFVRMDDFLAVGGFDETMSGPEDWDLDKKIRQRGMTDIIKSPVYHNEGEFELKKYLAKKGYYIKSFDQYVAKWGPGDPDVKKQMGFYYRFLRVFLEKGKWKKIVRHPILAAAMYFLRGLVGVTFLIKK